MAIRRVPLVGVDCSKAEGDVLVQVLVGFRAEVQVGADMCFCVLFSPSGRVERVAEVGVLPPYVEGGIARRVVQAEGQ